MVLSEDVILQLWCKWDDGDFKVDEFVCHGRHYPIHMLVIELTDGLCYSHFYAVEAEMTDNGYGVDYPDFEEYKNDFYLVYPYKVETIKWGRL